MFFNQMIPFDHQVNKWMEVVWKKYLLFCIEFVIEKGLKLNLISSKSHTMDSFSSQSSTLLVTLFLLLLTGTVVNPVTNRNSGVTCY